MASDSSRVCLTSNPIDLGSIISKVQKPSAGGISIFIGAVRNENEGRPVVLLEYEAYETMAIDEMQRCISEIEQSSHDLCLAVTHRIGKLYIGEMAVVCAASAPHRKEAIEACHRLINLIKARVPIWKREYGDDGAYWVGWRDARCNEHAH